jgi:hypothetical protein
MESYGAVLLRFPKAALRSVERTPTPVIPQVETWTIPMATPQVARGEFVREELSEAPASGRTDRPAWRATGALTKSDTDTFLFVRLGYPQPLDLSRAEYLVLSTAVPEGQSTPLELLVVLQEEGGGDFLAGTGRSLGCAGSETTYVPLKRFQLAGWSKDNDGRLDAGRVREIRVGWGGYLGKAGERIQFDAALPQAACVKPAR